MAFLSLTDLVQKTIKRLRQVPGLNTQLYSEDEISTLIEEVYYEVRADRWWDHLTTWYDRQLDGTTGKVTVALTGAHERFRDIERIVYNNGMRALPLLTPDLLPGRYTGTVPRYIQPLTITEDPTGEYLFRVVPYTAVTTVDQALSVRLRADPANIFTTPSVVVPFDDSVLVNLAAARFAASDGTNPAQVEMMRQVGNARLKQLREQHDTAVLDMDPRTSYPMGLDSWAEDFR